MERGEGALVFNRSPREFQSRKLESRKGIVGVTRGGGRGMAGKDKKELKKRAKEAWVGGEGMANGCVSE